MKKSIFLLLICPIICFSQPKAKSDTIRIKTERCLGRDIGNSFSIIPERDYYCSKYLLPKTSGIPDTLCSIREFIMPVDYEQAKYQAKFKKDSAQLFSFNIILDQDSLKFHKDYIKTFICVITGMSKDSTRFYILDTDNDLSYKGEKAFRLSGMGVNQSKEIHKVEFERYQNETIISDSLFVKVGDNHLKNFTNRDTINKIELQIQEFRTAKLKIKNRVYDIILSGVGGSYDYEKGFLFIKEGELTDFELNDFNYRYKCKKVIGDHIELGNTKYTIDQINRNGEEIILTRGKK